MTREEAIEHLKNMAEHSYPNEEYLMAIKALEQQPCDYYDADNKTCRRSEVPKEPCEDVLDKIRAEIRNIEYLSCPQPNVVLNDVLQIIDKYKAESEDKL